MRGNSVVVKSQLRPVTAVTDLYKHPHCCYTFEWVGVGEWVLHKNAQKHASEQTLHTLHKSFLELDLQILHILTGQSCRTARNIRPPYGIKVFHPTRVNEHTLFRHFPVIFRFPVEGGGANMPPYLTFVAVMLWAWNFQGMLCRQRFIKIFSSAFWRQYFCWHQHDVIMMS